MNDEYSYIQLKKTNTTLIDKLVKTAALIHNRTEDNAEWLKWKYFNSPFGQAISLIALDRKKNIAGEVTFGVYEMILNNSPIKCLISYQTMVHPNHQKKGLFSNLTKKVLKIAEEQNIELVFNFPNKASFKPFLKLKFSPINHIKNWVCFCNPFNIIYQPLALKKSFIANSVNSINNNALALLTELKHYIKPIQTKDTLTPNRTYDFLKWRYFSYPLYEYYVIDCEFCFAIIRCGKRGTLNEVQIMEIFSKQSKIEVKGLKKLKQKIKKQINPDILILNLSENHPISSIIKKVNFYSLPHNINFFSFAINKMHKPMINKSSLVITATEFHRY